MFRPVDLQNHPFFIKTINVRGTNADFWNSFVAAITKRHGVIDPLAHLDLRGGTRGEHVVHTHGMMPIVGQEDQFRWGQRAFIQNPNEVERAFRPVVHAEPMYTPEQKELFSKPQSTTLVYVQRNIRPALFASLSGVKYLSGVLIPANNRYALINRIMRYDSGTIGRPYDRADYPPEKIFNSLEEIYATQDLAGAQARYTEILARLRWYDPTHDLDNPIKPALFVYIHNEIDLGTAHSSLELALFRAQDLQFAFLRKFGIRQNIPIAIYRFDAPELQRVLVGYYELEDGEDISTFQDQLLNSGGILWPLGYAEHSRRRYNTRQLYLQHGIYQLLTVQTLSNPDFAALLNEPIPELKPGESIFYLESLRALVRAIQLRLVDHTLWHQDYQNLLRPFLEGSAEEIENKFITYGFNADFGALPESQRLAKINIRFFPETHPLRLKLTSDGLFHSIRLMNAIQYRRYAEVDTILHMPGLNVNYQDSNGETALILACSNKLTDIANRLLEIPSINVSLYDNTGSTALIWAVVNNMETTVYRILEKPNVNINHQNAIGNTALLIACRQDDPTIANRLLRMQDIDVNLVGTHGDTPLIWAANRNFVLTVYLLRARPNLNISHASNNGSTAIGIAQSKNHLEILRILRSPCTDPLEIAMQGYAGYVLFLTTPESVKNILKFYRDSRTPMNSETLKRLETAWHNSKEPACFLCQQPHHQFSTFKRRHHCRGCGEAICAKHSQGIPMRMTDGSIIPIRYCTTCVPIGPNSAPPPVPPIPT